LGGWDSGDKGTVRNILFCDQLAALGYHVVSANYSLHCNKAGLPIDPDDASFPEAIQDAKAVVSWVRQGPLSAVFPQCVVAVGDSAGGHIAALLGMTDGVAQFAPNGAYGNNYEVDGVVTFSTPSELLWSGCNGYDIANGSITCSATCAVGAGSAPDPCMSGQCPTKVPCRNGVAGWCDGYTGTLHTAPEMYVGREWGSYEELFCRGLGFHPNTWTPLLFLNASPSHWATVDDAPYFGFHSELDPVVPRIHTTLLVQALNAKGVTAMEAIKTPAQGCGHAFQGLFHPAACDWDPLGTGLIGAPLEVQAAAAADAAIQIELMICQ
jgi:acetyl esterase/lipase